MRRDLGALAEVRKLLANKRFTFGDVVSLALHDTDNERGVAATIQGTDVVLLGDDQLDKKTQTKNGKLIQGNEQGRAFAVLAVKAGVSDVKRAFVLGKQGKSVDQVLDLLLDKNLFGLSDCCRRPSLRVNNHQSERRSAGNMPALPSFLTRQGSRGR